MRKTLFILLLLGVFGLLAAQTPLLYDDFTGLTTTSNLAGQSSWTKGGNGPDATVANTTPLTYTGYNGGGGEYVVMPTATATASRVYKALSSTPAPGTNTFYYSVLVRLSSATSTGDYFMSLGDPTTGTAYFARLFAKSSGSGFVIGGSKLANVANANFGNTVYNFNQTYLVIVRYTAVTGTANDLMYVWVNPALSAEPTTSSAEVTVTSSAYDANPSSVGNFHWHNRTANNPVGAFDGVRVAYGSDSGTAWTNLAAYASAGTPTITVNPSTLTGFTYVFGAGPSAPAQSFTISGANLTNNISIAAPTNFEISETEGSGYTTPIVLVPVSGSVADKTIYVRLKAGLTAGTYDAELITATSTGALDKTVSCSGSVIAPAYIHAGASELDPLACIQNNPSDEMRSYTLYGENTTSPIVVTAPTGFQIATSEIGDWDSSLELPSSFDGTIYVRMFATSTGEFEGVITHTSGTATQVNVSVSGECFAPSVVWNITQNLTPFTAQAGVVSSVQSYSLSATNATGDLVVSTEAPFELSTTGTGNWLTELSLAYNFSGNVYVRMNASTPGIYTKNINHSSYEASPTSFGLCGCRDRAFRDPRPADRRPGDPLQQIRIPATQKARQHPRLGPSKMMDKKELAAISAVMAIVNAEESLPFVERPEPQIQTVWQSWGARQTMQYRDITQRRIIKRTR